MTPAEFKSKWAAVQLTERSASQQHFLDLCELVGHAKPAAADPTGESFTFERGAAKHGGGGGWADVWKRGHFGWEYKGKHKDLTAAYDQLLKYREALENPPVLVVCDMDRIEVHTNFTATAKSVHAIHLEELDDPRNLEILRAVFFQPTRLRPGATSQAITTEAARQLAEIAQSLRARGLEPHAVAHFLDRIVFCLFAEDIDLLPNRVFTRLVERTVDEPERFTRYVRELFEAMSTGGDFILEPIRHFNGSLFSQEPVLALTADELKRIRGAARLDWGAVDPSILGTLFERGLDPEKRSQLGAHYTSREDIETLVEPVVMQPLRREWQAIRDQVEAALAKGSGPAARQKADRLVYDFLTRLGEVKVLDPACGSGNFLFVTLQKLKDLEKEVIVTAMERTGSSFLPVVGPWQLYGIEVNPYAFDLAQMTVWIGYLQWTRANGFGVPQEPILRPLAENFRCMDAVLDLTDPEQPREPDWPAVDFIVGNPPFLGDKMMRGQLGDEYVDRLRALYGKRIPHQSDLCCYWFERARAEVDADRCERAGLLATQGIRGGSNRRVLARIKESGDIFWAVGDRPWVLDGATVHVSLIAFDDGSEATRVVDGESVPVIHANLTRGSGTGWDPTGARVLPENEGTCFLGVMKAGPFDISEEVALEMLLKPNPHGRPNSDVLRPRLTARDILQRTRVGWIIDFGVTASEAAASLYEAPWHHVEQNVKSTRIANRLEHLAKSWWLYGKTRPAMRQAMKGSARFVVTPEVSKHRIFTWLDAVFLADHQTRAFPQADDYLFGVLHSRIHEVWARALGTQLRERESGFRYTPTSCFDTFPLPQVTTDQEAMIALAARELDRLRNNWLNPPEWTREEVLVFSGAVDGPWARYVREPNAAGIGTVRYPRLVAKDANAAGHLAKRTLTNLYNQRPTWLDLAHRKLDEAVFAAYGWPADLGDEEVLERLLALNLERAGGGGLLKTDDVTRM